ncbi:hypothetical protein KUTeg_009554 [Tegillarca granosa]|uniref:Peptidase M14 domain-containing protein n=1 Tax=Tegillarca granosa TaxID=220873 RepID=A0ABQ9F6K3_TEGGR|nr:hypothetical protein KUTeg_009554 [Tegillarca granosa]
MAHTAGDKFPEGITNGAEWYPVIGGMQDVNYIKHGCFELTLEVSCCKYPPTAELPQFWSENKDALVNLLFQVHMGVKGIVKLNGSPVSGAVLKIQGREEANFKSTSYGEYWRLLMPGSYQIITSHSGYTTSRNIEVQAGAVTRLDIEVTQNIQPNSNTASIISMCGWILFALHSLMYLIL